MQYIMRNREIEKNRNTDINTSKNLKIKSTRSEIGIKHTFCFKYTFAAHIFLLGLINLLK